MKAPTTCIGVDPGTRDGACVLMRGAEVIDWLVWWTQDGLRARDSRGAVVGDTVPRMVNAWLGGFDGYRLAVEGLRAYPGKSNHQAMLALAYGAGEVGGVLSLGSFGETMRPLASEWRAMVLGLGQRVSATPAEAHAVRVAPALFTWTARWPEDMRKDARGALAEAACIARWGTLYGGGR